MDLLATRAKVLVVDDSKLIRVAAERILRDEYQVIMVDDGQQAWDLIINDEDIRVVFSDITMPVLDGFSLLKRVRKSSEPRLISLPFIIMTTDADDESRRATALQFGATDFISKPFNSTDLKARAKAHVTSENIARELKQKAVQLEKNASKDPLTNLNNKSYLQEKLGQDYSYAIRHLAPISLVRFDIEEFNQVFLQEGKPASNRLIQSVASVISNHVHEEHTPARVGLSAFIIVMPGSNVKETEAVVESICKDIKDLDFSFTNLIADINLSTVIYAPNLGEELKTESILNDLDELANQLLADHRSKRLLKNHQENIESLASKLNTKPNVSIEQLLACIDEGNESKVQQQLPELIVSLLPLLKYADDSVKKKLIDVLTKKT